MAFDLDMTKGVYSRMQERVDAAFNAAGEPLTLAKKILHSQLWEVTPAQVYQKGKIIG